MASPKTQVISIEQLREGMYVVQLDIPWMNSPFLTHSKLIKSPKDIQALVKAGVKNVSIDLEKSVTTDLPVSSESKVSDHSSQTKTSESVAPPAAIASAMPSHSAAPTLAEEMQVALGIRKKIKDAVENLQRSFETSMPVAVASLLPIVDSTLQSLERNSQALMNLVHMTRKAKKLADHAFGTFSLALNLAVTRGVSSEEKEHLGIAALLHEAGWAQLPMNLLGSRVRYTPQQLALIQKHIALGEAILGKSDLPPLVRRVIAEHHELLDGSGYPKGLKGEQIHPLSRLLTVVDQYEERVHHLADRPGMIATNALRSLYLDADKGRLDTEVVASFINMLGIYPVSTVVQLNTGEKAVVVEVHPQALLLPTVKVFFDANGQALTKPYLLNLSEKRDDGLVRTIESAIETQDVAEAKKFMLSESDWM